MAYAPINRGVQVPSDLSAVAFEDADISLFELFLAVMGGTRPGIIEVRTFARCRLQGPAVVLISGGVQFDGCNFGDSGGDIRNLLLAPVGTHALGTIPMRNCRFDGCEFYNVGFTGSQSVIDMMSGVPSGGGSPQ